MKKSPRINSGLSDQYKYDDYDTYESKNSQSNGKTNPNKMKDLNISSNKYTLSCRILSLKPDTNSLGCSYLAIITAFVKFCLSYRRISIFGK